MHRVSQKEFDELYGTDDIWRLFEQRQDGEIEVDDELHWMRVGLHFRRPTQAIMTFGKYKKMKPIEKYTQYPLRMLDPKRGPDNCLYYYPQTQDHPQLPTWVPQQAPSVYHYAAQQLYSGLGYPTSPYQGQLGSTTVGGISSGGYGYVVGSPQPNAGNSLGLQSLLGISAAKNTP